MPLRTLLPNPKAPENPNLKLEVDIIAVHGLNPKSKPADEHAWDTWRSPAGDEGRLWLRDDLSSLLPYARVFLYEYDATVVYGSDRSSFCDKANMFLEDIRIEREDESCRGRPIIFLGHSLGGILIEQSLVNAHNNKRYEEILKATTGLAFFATPHNGGRDDLVAFGAIVSNLATFLGWKKGDNIIQTLQSGSLYSDILQDHWRHRLGQFDIVSFRGTLDNIVAKKSAMFGLPGNKEQVIDLDADHSTICRFGTEDKDQYNLRKVKSNIADLCNKAKAAVKPFDDHDLQLLQLPPGTFIQVLRGIDDHAHSSVEEAGKQTMNSKSSLSHTQIKVHAELGGALALATGAMYFFSSTGPLFLATSVLSTAGLAAAYNLAVNQNGNQLNSSLAEAQEAASRMERELVDGYQRTMLLAEYEKLEQERKRFKEEQEERDRVTRLDREAVDLQLLEEGQIHEAKLRSMLERTIEANEMLASLQENREGATAVVQNGAGWLPTTIFKAVKAFIAYLAMWI